LVFFVTKKTPLNFVASFFGDQGYLISFWLTHLSCSLSS